MRFGVFVCAIAALTVTSRVAEADERTDRAFAEQLCNARDPGCDWIGTLSSLERATVQRAITRRGYTVEPSPWNKVIGKVHVYNETSSPRTRASCASSITFTSRRRSSRFASRP